MPNGSIDRGETALRRRLRQTPEAGLPGGALIVTFYLGDEMISSQLPVSSGAFAVVLVLLFANRLPSVPRAVRLQVVVWSFAGLVIGTLGAALTQTPMSAFSFATIVLVAALWLVGSALDEQGPPLLSARAAFVGVALGTLALVLSLLGWDAFSRLTGVETNRGAGLFLEPSHLTLYLMPLWLVAYRHRPYRPWLLAALALIVLTCFSASLVGLLVIAMILRSYMADRAHGARQGRDSRPRLWPIALIVVLLLVALPIRVGEVSIQSYIGDRLQGLFGGPDSDNQNLSSLVVLQGVELAYRSVVSSYGLGVGLGNLGTSAAIVEQSIYRELINLVTNADLDLNVRDGGLLASKLIGEIGIFVVVFAALIKVRLGRLRQVRRNDAKAFYHAFATTLLCLLFVRALPYFAAPTCLAAVTLASLRPSRTSRPSSTSLMLQRPRVAET